MEFLDYLLNKGFISNDSYQEIKSRSDDIINYIFENEIIEKDLLISYIKEFFTIDYINVVTRYIEEDIVNLIPENLIIKYDLIAFDKDDDTVSIAVSNPYDYVLDEDLNIVLYPLKAKKYFAFRKEILTKFENIENNNDENRNIYDGENIGISVQSVDKILRSALSRGVSDVHIEPIDKKVRVRFRVDGDLEIQNEYIFPIGEYQGLVSRVKVLADMDPTKNREAQDGRIAEYEYNKKKFDMRVSTMPTVYGEKIVMRVLEDKSKSIEYSPLGFNEKEIFMLENMLQKDNGILLITGETGSGKSTTLYTILNRMNSESVNICTVENPVESSLPGINQVQVNEQAGITFTSALRTFLRQDPDIIVVGETRDTDTAATAVEAANTGHFVRTTIHTNNTTTTINRLIAMGIEPYKLADNISGIISQKLVKKICSVCGKPHSLNSKELDFLKTVEERYGRKIITGDEVFYSPSPNGCPACKNGYKGRVVIAEILLIDDVINELISENLNSSELRKRVSTNPNFMPYEIESIEKAKLGIVNINDIIKMFN